MSRKASVVFNIPIEPIICSGDSCGGGAPVCLEMVGSLWTGSTEHFLQCHSKVFETTHVAQAGLEHACVCVCVYTHKYPCMSACAEIWRSENNL